ncbi:hypothetical protein SCG7086_AD_00300 [Chlamydiales bacterium SCGC AG-110-P3]|nr:hypothetical protein SCG7086_AD_00300 [Chlamydiales bacterium SCGC AG-110-P3]
MHFTVARNQKKIAINTTGMSYQNQLTELLPVASKATLGNYKDKGDDL